MLRNLCGGGRLGLRYRRLEGCGGFGRDTVRRNDAERARKPSNLYLVGCCGVRHYRDEFDLVLRRVVRGDVSERRAVPLARAVSV